MVIALVAALAVAALFVKLYLGAPAPGRTAGLDRSTTLAES